MTKYANFGVEGSDVYVYKRGVTPCEYVCLHASNRVHRTKTAEAMIQHLENHKLEGDVVPESCFNELVKETGGQF